VSDAIGYKVGQTWWLSMRDHARGSREVVVEKVGRKWATLTGGYRVALGTLHVDGGEYSSLGMLWRSRAEYEAHAESNRLIWRLRDRIGYGPTKATADNIYYAAKILGIEL